MIYKYSSRNPLGGVGCFVFGILALAALWFILRGLYKILFWASPVLLIVALFINWRAVMDTLKNWLRKMETNPVGGLFSAALAVLLFPFFSLYLFVKALGYNKIEQRQREFEQTHRAEEEFVEFEELESRPKGGVKAEEPAEPFVLPEKEHRQEAKEEPPKEKPKNPYDQLFE
jgi:hypothetical protein